MSIKLHHLAVLVVALVLAIPLVASGDSEPSGPAGGGSPSMELFAAPAATPNVPVAYIATGLNFPDALAASAAAGGQRAPVLLVTQSSIPLETATELTRLSPDSIVVVGGTAVISTTVETALHAYTSGAVTRLAGANRYATAAAISSATFPTSGLTSGTTARGEYGLAFNAVSAGDIGTDTFMFGFTMSAPPVVELIRQGNTGSAACPGSTAMPEAEPGHLCVYEAHGFGLSTLCVFSPSVNSCLTNNADPFGAAVWATASGAGIAYSYGTWAATSP